MAEVIGIIGSSIAVVQAAQSLASLADSLSRLWREIRDVPERISTLLTELEVTGAFVDAFEGELLTDAEGGSTSLQQLVIRQFRDAHAELAALVEDLRAETAVSAVKGSRRKGLIARTKVALKKDVLDKYERRLRKALDHLELVKGTYLIQGYEVMAMSPQWLLGKTWCLHLSIAARGWKCVFRHYVTVPPTPWETTSELFGPTRVIRGTSPAVPFNLLRGSWESLRKSFDDGVATPYCVDKDGKTLVHLAMQYRPAFVEPLLRMGLDVYHEDWRGRPAYHSHFTPIRGEYPAFIHRLFLSQGVYDEVTSWSEKTTTDIMLRNPLAFDWLVSTVFQDFYQWPLERRLAVLSHYPYTHSFLFLCNKVFGRLFHPSGHFRREELLHYIPSLGFCALQWATDRYFYIWNRRWNWRARSEQWRQAQCIIREVAAVMKSPDFTSLHETGSMSGLLATFSCALGRCNWAGAVRHSSSNTLPDQDQRIAHDGLLKDWVSDLAAGGMDLEAYGESEKEHYKRRGVLSLPQKPREVLLDPKEGIFYAPQRSLNGFTFGPKAEDWSLIWEWHPDPEGLAGEFWTLIEDPPLAIPGSWVDEPESFYFTNPRVRQKKVWPPPKPVKLFFGQAGLYSE
ncbi:hypothetical protein B0J18DRAFT_468234 [Chaetomium sp. MPI-SDFR-AT-0129]|nr:hypothetical protein B0J18DRAFT_468234 [Chaetomium sp. MPI-SDFR-AT-0129]